MEKISKWKCFPPGSISKFLLRIKLLTLLVSISMLSTAAGKYYPDARETESTIKSKAQQEQQKIISGLVTDQAGAPMAGVSIVIKGTTKGTTTDSDGKYTLEVAGSGTLVFSFLGYNPQEIAVNNRSSIDVKMEQSLVSLTEYVVVGYGTQLKKDLTGSISSVSGADLIQPSVAGFDQMLQGKAAGVQVSQTTGAPGGNVNVIVRGVSSITGGTQPLYVIDGFPVSMDGAGSDFNNFGASTYTPSGMANNIQDRINPLSLINPSDIESIEILKDASATAIYGSRGSNGVIIITTKRGISGKSHLNFDATYGVQKIAHKLDMMNAQEYAAYVAEGRDNRWVHDGGNASDPNSVRPTSSYVPPAFRDPSSITQNTDWQDAIYRMAPVQNYQLTASGGNDKVKYLISGGYFDQKGIIYTSDYQRYSIRTNIDAAITDNLKLGSSILGSYALGRFPNTEGHYGQVGVISMALCASPTIPVYDANGNYYFNQDDVTYGMGFLVNPLLALQEYSDNRKVSTVLINNYLEYKFLEGLTFRSTIGINLNANTIKLWKSSKIPLYTNLSTPATAGVTKAESLNWLNENTLTYKHIFKEKHSLDALIGFTVQKDSYDRLSAGATNFPTDYVTYLAAGVVNSGTHYVSEWSMMSFLARVNYSYNGKYLFTGTVRRDGSSRFGSNNKWGTFPSVAAGWNVSEEQFMKSLDFISNLKLRVSYGLSGNNQIGNYTSLGLLSPENYVINNALTVGLVPSNMSNNDLTWEKSAQTNFGFDLALFKDRIKLATDIYRDKKTDLLLAVQLPAATGFTSSTQNVGDLENKGVEIGLQTVNLKGKNFEWTSNLTISHNKNKVLRLTTSGARIFNSDYQVTQVGSPIASFYLMHQTGVFQNAAEVASSPLQDPSVVPGDPKFEDITKDGRIDASDKKIVGSPWPDYTWGFGNVFKYGNFSLNVMMVGSHGASTYSDGVQLIYGLTGVQNCLTLALNRWRSESEPGDGMTPRAIRSNYAYGFGIGTTRMLFDNSFVRIKDISLTYDLPKNVISRLALNNLSVYFDISNVYTWTNYPGYDPESNTHGNNLTMPGLDYLTYPLPRTYTLGIKLLF
jgi:TonB-dependent starch-binding outer membrane protein SusC